MKPPGNNAASLATIHSKRTITHCQATTLDNPLMSFCAIICASFYLGLCGAHLAKPGKCIAAAEGAGWSFRPSPKAAISLFLCVCPAFAVTKKISTALTPLGRPPPSPAHPALALVPPQSLAGPGACLTALAATNLLDAFTSWVHSHVTTPLARLFNYLILLCLVEYFRGIGHFPHPAPPPPDKTLTKQAKSKC